MPGKHTSLFTANLYAPDVKNILIRNLFDPTDIPALDKFSGIRYGCVHISTLRIDQNRLIAFFLVRIRCVIGNSYHSSVIAVHARGQYSFTRLLRWFTGGKVTILCKVIQQSRLIQGAQLVGLINGDAGYVPFVGRSKMKP